MGKLPTLSALLLLFTAVTGLDSGIEGTWIANMNTPNGDVEITYHFNVDADTLTGSVVGGMGEIEILNGKVDGNEFSFDTHFNGFTIAHNCELKEDDTIVMEFQFGSGGPGPQELILRRSP